MVKGFPDGRAKVALWIPIRRILGPLEKADFSSTTLHHARFRQSAYTCGFCSRENVCFPKSILIPPMLLEPMKTELRIGVEIVFRQKTIY